MSTEIYPLKLEPIFSQRLWGGSRLADLYDLTVPEGQDPYGEVWLVYADNKISNGVFAGETLQTVADRLGQTLLGSVSTARYGSKIPLLAKFIDAKADLSIQVHPDDAYALKNEAQSGHLGKTEAWYILEHETDSSIVWGFKQTLLKEALRQAVQDGTLESYINTVRVQEGDVIYNPAGTVHAIGAGNFLFEIQQSSDLTYRLYDFNRRDAQGNVRDLHLDKALHVADLNAGESAKAAPKTVSDTVTRLVDAKHFVMEAWQLAGEKRAATTDSSLDILVPVSGSLEIVTDHNRLTLTYGEAAVLPAALGDYALQGNARVMRCYLPAS